MRRPITMPRMTTLTLILTLALQSTTSGFTPDDLTLLMIPMLNPDGAPLTLTRLRAHLP